MQRSSKASIPGILAQTYYIEITIGMITQTGNPTHQHTVASLGGRVATGGGPPRVTPSRGPNESVHIFGVNLQEHWTNDQVEKLEWCRRLKKGHGDKLKGDN